jgi:hypothetical protein
VLDDTPGGGLTVTLVLPAAEPDEHTEHTEHIEHIEHIELQEGGRP